MCSQLEVAPLGALAELDWPDLVRRYAVGVEWFDPRMFHLSEQDLDTPFKAEAKAGLLPVRALVTHLADCELVYLHRIRRAVSEETPVLGVFDEQAFFDGPLYGKGTRSGVTSAPPVAGSVAVIHTLRRWALDWLFDMDEPTQNRSAMHPERGSMTVRDMLAVATWHLEHHTKFLNAKIEHLLGPMPQAQPMPAGGCGPGCGCAAKQSGGGDAQN
jgi:hypothetical protein